MAEGLLQMLGSGQQAQQQQQGNLLGGLFQSESQARRQGRERLLGQALQIAQQQDPIGTGFAVAGGLLGEGIGRAMGRVTPEEARQQKFAGLQTQLMQEGLDPTQDPAGFYTRVAELSQERGDMQTALRAAAKARELAPEPQELSNVRDIETEDGTVTVGTLNNRLVEVTPEGPKPFSGERVKETKGDSVNVRLPDGSFVRGRELEDGTVVDLQGREFPATATVVGLDLAASKESDLPQKDVDILNSKEIGVKNYIDLANEAISVYNQNPSANTLAAEGTRILSGIQSEFDALLDVTGVELANSTSASKILDPSTYESKFQELGLENAGLKSLYLSLALSQAQAEAEQKGRALSDKDVERFLSQQGAQYGNPKFATELLRRNASRLENAFVNEYETRTGKDFDGRFDDLLEFAPSEEDAAGQETVNWDDL